MSYPKDISQWCFYFHHCCCVLMALYPFKYERTKNCFHLSIPLLIASIITKMIKLLLNLFAMGFFSNSKNTLQFQLLPTSFSFIVDLISWIRVLMLLITHLIGLKEYASLLNYNVSLTRRLLKHFPDVKLKESLIYQKLFPLRVCMVINTFFYIIKSPISEKFEKINMICNVSTYLSGFFLTDQFICQLETIERCIEILNDRIKIVHYKLCFMHAGYNEVDYCEDINQIAIAHSKIYGHFQSILGFYSIHMFLWLLIVCGCILLMIFQQFCYLYYHLGKNQFLAKLNSIVLLMFLCMETLLVVYKSIAIPLKQKILQNIVQKLAFHKFRDDRLRRIVGHQIKMVCSKNHYFLTVEGPAAVNPDKA
ncbi:uncharacterized protein LOC129774290 [Toxorhynchites rutilus septentrionalis]|uniref:uncharacterized protein LOC129774290 n=1 Tax=Toxorhynchites rutilus septentrionalis TaxID=329112 RepID=UPI002479A350|nr:uncharacterized protein LOC129774290 [Toxorhynchites rutilus septentrionalis]